ncbi:MAG: NADH:ubiquinone reductase (Na(+)-transporting) subunit C [Spirosomaceae bacterium]|nr:NADH:ubiquinone reductase (Na(+)-transporting) subunit C [Spirosomataceae bacterium]MDP5140199.1 NADH:ubiquinone reductase (Na(+)-transporting) subunit C [Spirosomataceae bacterium]
MHSNRYTFLFAIGLSVITAMVLVVISEGLKPLQEANVALDKKKNILQSVRIYETEREAVENAYDKSVEELVIDSEGEILTNEVVSNIEMKNEVAKTPAERKMPLYVYTKEDGKKCYIIPMQGVGLWGPIWGYISLESDFNTVYGAYFDHKTETPGLGAEISERFFQDRFTAKKIMDGQTFVSVNVIKSSAKVEYSDEHRVDAISGGTITSDGVDEMIDNCVKPYLTYFKKIAGASPQLSLKGN